jgi:RNA polymerase sigma-70 factor (sigma-E family)
MVLVARFADLEGQGIAPRWMGAAVDPDALVASLFQHEGASLVRMARIFTDDRNAAEDLVQEAFIRLHRSAHRIKDPAKAAPYLRSIVLNLARDHNRRGLMSLRHQEAIALPAAPEAPEDRIVAGDDERMVLEGLRSLPPRQRDCMVLRFYFDLTEREIGETLGISPNSVKTHCRRGMASLRDRLEAADGR